MITYTQWKTSPDDLKSECRVVLHNRNLKNSSGFLADIFLPYSYVYLRLTHQDTIIWNDTNYPHQLMVL